MTLTPGEPAGLRSLPLASIADDQFAIEGLVPQGDEPYFFAGAFPSSTTLRSNFPLLSAKNTHSEAVSQAVVCR
jgi:hypothetical protein